MSHILEIDSVQYSIGNRKLLSDIYLRCATGAVVGLLGRNGCGKSTLLQILFGSKSVQDCSVRVDGQSIKPAYRSRNGLAYLPQFNFIPGSMAVAAAFQQFGVSFDNCARELYELESFRYKSMNQLSGGWRRLVEVCLILKKPGHFVLLDEPLTHIMPLHHQQIMEWIIEEKKHKGIVLSDHLHEAVLPLCDTIYLLKDGKTYPCSSREELIQLGYLSASSKV